ncbi:HAD-like domain-containing protein [Xylariaceae sp. FL0804]|nr:HAD-like domain-containing protein [Xylariaceae sp. FL0804]
MSSQHPDLTTFKALSFDCYGTLIDWQTGLLGTLRVLTTQLPAGHEYAQEPPLAALHRFGALTNALEAAQPTLPYNELIVSALTQLAGELALPLPDSVAGPFGNSPGTWAPFPDTVSGLQRLAARYRLAILSNVDNANIAATVERRLAPAPFALVCTAQDAGAYKPARAAFDHLFDRLRRDLGIEPEGRGGELLHVGVSLGADMAPARRLGLESVWISRGMHAGGDEGMSREETDRVVERECSFKWRFDTIGDFADEVERQFQAKGL